MLVDKNRCTMRLFWVHRKEVCRYDELIEYLAPGRVTLSFLENEDRQRKKQKRVTISLLRSSNRTKKNRNVCQRRRKRVGWSIWSIKEGKCERSLLCDGKHNEEILVGVIYALSPFIVGTVGRPFTLLYQTCFIGMSLIPVIPAKTP